MKIYLTDTTEKTVTTTANLVKNLIDGGKRCVVFAEDKITLSLELEIAKRLGGGFFDVDVITFKRYVSNKNTLAKVISKESSVMLVRKIISEIKSELSCFQTALATPNMAVVLYELISQLQSAKITPADLKRLIDGEVEVQPALISKVKDIYKIYHQYDKEIKSRNLYDGNLYLSLMPELIKKDEELKNVAVIVSGFQTATRQRSEIFNALNLCAKSFYAVVPFDKDSPSYVGETYYELKKIDSSAEEISLYKNQNLAIEFIKKYFYNPQVFAEDFKPFLTEKVSVFEAKNTKEEAEWLAKDILNQIKNKNLRFNDVSVAVGSLESSLTAISRAFSNYDIPFYVQKSTPLSTHAVCGVLTALLDFQRKGLSVKDFVKIINFALVIPDKNLADGLLNYVYKHMINRKGFERPFERPDKRLQEYEYIRQRIITAIEPLKTAKTVNDYVYALKFAIKTLCLEENLQKLTERLNETNLKSIVEINSKVIKKLNALLDETVTIMDNCKITALDFKSVFLSGATATNISLIPAGYDAVYVGECKDVKIKSAKILYAVALNGDVPFTKSDTALLTDGDLSVLDGFNVIIEPKIKAVNKRERENVLITLCSFSEELKLSYSLTDDKVMPSVKADALKYLISAFSLTPKKVEFLGGDFLTEKTALLEVARLYSEYKNGNVDAISKISSLYRALDELNLNGIKEKCDALLGEKSQEKFIEKGDNLSVLGGEISASVLESYFSCPYKNYAQNVLKLKDSETGEVRVNQTGTLLHTVTEKYVKNLQRVTDKLSSDELVVEIFNELKGLEENKKYFEQPKLTVAFESLIKECKRVCYNVYLSIKNSSFLPKYFEKRFGRGQEILPIKLNAKSGEVDLKGVVDRVDEFDNYVRIIDYKSGKITSSDESFYTGNKLQLYLYMNAFVSNGKMPAGAYYYPVKDVFSETEDNFVMRGKTVSSSDVLIASDNTLKDNLKSKILSVTLSKKDGKPNKYSQVLSQEDMMHYLKYAVKVSENCIDEIRNGYCTANPYESSCDYCAYGGMCGFSLENGRFRKSIGVSSETICQAVKNLEKSTDKAVIRDDN